MQITIKNEYLKVAIDAIGAELHSIRSADGTEYLWQGDPAIWEGQAPNLFPYIARMTAGTYVFEGKTYHMPIHGFLPTAELTLKELGDDKAVFMLTDTEETRNIYPFAFTLEIAYTLDANRIKIQMLVKNEGSKRMYFGIGGHPGFRVPLEDGLEFTDYRLEFKEESHPSRVLFTKDVFLSGEEERYPLKENKSISLSHDLFDEDAVILKNVSHEVKLCTDKGNRSVTVRYPDMNIIGFWHMPLVEAPYVCIEPWSSLPSRQGIVENISQQSDLIALDAQMTYQNLWEIEIQ